MKPGQWRKVVGCEFYRVRCRVGQGSIMLILDCGHRLGRKQSECKNVTVGSRVWCTQCSDAKENKA